MVRVRSSLAQLPAYVPGRKMPGAVALASNESPYGLLPGVAARLAELADGVSRYPDLSATALHCLGIDHKRLTYHYGGRDMRLTDVSGEVIHDILA